MLVFKWGHMILNKVSADGRFNSAPPARAKVLLANCKVVKIWVVSIISFSLHLVEGFILGLTWHAFWKHRGTVF
jgi:hypothetical protein